MKVFCDLDLGLRMYTVPLNLRERLSALHNDVEFVYGEDIANQSDTQFDIYWGNRPPKNLQKIQGKIRWIHLGCVGIDKIKKIKCLSQTTVITHSPGSATEGVANHTLYQILDIYRQGRILHHIDRNKSIYEGRRIYDTGSPDILNNKKVLIVGYGDIGREVGKYLGPFCCHITGIASRSRKDNIDIFEIKELVSKASNADIVIGLLPQDDSLREIFNKQLFASMNGGVFINNGRASHVDEIALLKALQNGQIKGAALDNYEPHGVLASNTENLNLLLSPHIAVCNPNYWKDQIKLFDSNLNSFKANNINTMKGVVKL